MEIHRLSPEIHPSYHDLLWPITYHITYHNPYNPPTPTNLYAKNYGYNTDQLLFCGYFTAGGAWNCLTYLSNPFVISTNRISFTQPCYLQT